MTLGLQEAGLRVVCGVDNDPVAAETYRTSLGIRVVEDDIRNVTGAQLSAYVPKNRTLILGVCAPCQPFSKVRKAGRTRKDRDLLRAVATIVRSLRPTGIILENVPQIANGKKNSVLKEFCTALRKAGYSFAHGNVDAKDFGVPQTRRRMVLIGVRNRRKQLQLPIRNRCKRQTVRDTIRSLPPVKPGKKAPRRPLHRAAKLSQENMARLRATPHDGGDSRQWPESLRLPCHVESNGFYDVYGRMRWDSPAPTLTTRCNSLSNGRFGHPTQNRAITLLEAALLQTFPRRHRFQGNQNAIARQIGNAVPPKLAAGLAKGLLKQL